METVWHFIAMLFTNCITWSFWPSVSMVTDAMDCMYMYRSSALRTILKTNMEQQITYDWQQLITNFKLALASRVDCMHVTNVTYCRNSK